MDLDNIKKTWQQTDIRPDIGDDKIRKMLSNEGHSAFNSLLKYEKIGMWLMVGCLLLAYPLFFKYLPIYIYYVLSVVAGFFWQIYKIRKLKKLDIAQMNITEISNRIYSYRKIIHKEFIVGLIWFVIFAAFLVYWESADKGIHPVIYVVAMGIGLVCVIFIYKKLYWNNIKKLEAAIKEVEEFEKGNEE